MQEKLIPEKPKPSEANKTIKVNGSQQSRTTECRGGLNTDAEALLWPSLFCTAGRHRACGGWKELRAAGLAVLAPTSGGYSGLQLNSRGS